MDRRFRLPPLGTYALVLAGLALVLIIRIALFDWNWLRGPLAHYLTGKSGREVRIGELQVNFSFTNPTMRLRGLYIENAPWASSPQPMAVAGEVAFTFSMQSLRERRPIISRLVPIDAEVSMERRADGLRNWRLIHPEDRGPGRVRVMTLEARRSKVRFVNGKIDLDMVAVATPAEAGGRGLNEDDRLPNRLAIEGKYQGVRFAAAGLTGGVLSFRDSGLQFALRGHLTAGKTRVDVDGMFSDIFDPGPLDALVRVTGPTLSSLHPFLAYQPPASRPFTLEARIKQSDKKYTFAQLRGRLGDTDVAGEATYNRNSERPAVNVTLRSESAHLPDLAILAGVNYKNDDHPDKRAGAAKSGRDQPLENGVVPLFSARGIKPERLRRVDAHLQLEAKKLKAAAVPMLESLRLTADTTDGNLRVTALDVGLAGGHVVGSLALDGQVMPLHARVNLEARNIRLERLLPALPATVPSAGSIRSRLTLAGQGDSVAAMLADSTGTFAVIVDGGHISNLLDAKLGLNVGKILGLRIRGDRDINLNCGAAAFSFRSGVGKSQTIFLDTEQTHIDGMGTVDLHAEKFEFLLTPKPKKLRLFSLRSSIRVQGSFRNVGYRIGERVPLADGGSAIAPANIKATFSPLLDVRDANSLCAPMLTAYAAEGKVAARESSVARPQ